MPIIKKHKRKLSQEHIEKVRQAHLRRGRSRIVTCNNKACAKQFRRQLSDIGDKNYCSQTCYGVATRGRKSWNKGMKGVYGGWKIKDAPRGEDSPAWKGDQVGDRALHLWVESRRGIPDHCEDCGMTKPPDGKGIKRRYFQWANISHEYKRVLDDWRMLCYKCHNAFDNGYRKNKQSVC
jgi:hypothetical protein